MNAWGDGEAQIDTPGTPADPVRLRASEVPAFDPFTQFETLDPPRALWLPPSGPSLVGGGAIDTVSLKEPVSIDEGQRLATERFASIVGPSPEIARPRFVGGMAFDPSDPETSWETFPGCWFFLPRQQFVQQAERAWVTHLDSEPIPTTRSTRTKGSLPTVSSATPVTDRSAWLDQVHQVTEAIDAGVVRKVVLANQLEVVFDGSISVSTLARQLRNHNPDCVIIAMQPTPHVTFIAATPERLVSRRGSRIETDALAGSGRRAGDPTTDERLSTALAESEKDTFEHELVVEDIVSGLRSVGGEVSVGERTIKRLASIQHLHTPISATHDDPPHVLSLVDTLHPTPAVGGVPTDAALDAISRIESNSRGWYAAPVGWFDADGDGDFAIGIRSGVFNGTSATLFAGAGIVAESEPATEWDELQWKYRALLDRFDP